MSLHSTTVNSAKSLIVFWQITANDELFYAEAVRHVKKDNTFSFKNIRYEPNADLRGKKITIRFDRSKTDNVIVYFKKQRIGPAARLNLIANSKIKRQGV